MSANERDKMNTGIDTHKGTLVVNYVSPREKELEIQRLYEEAVRVTNELLKSEK